MIEVKDKLLFISVIQLELSAEIFETFAIDNL